MNKEIEDEIRKGNISTIAYFSPGGSTMLYTQKYVEEKDKKIENLQNIIKEVRKILKAMKHAEYLFGGKKPTNVDKCLEILDKVGNEE